ncbi:MAG: dienelactone hydrolase family protein [Hyphomicrobium sp.]|jgi:dienelactone hydrolase
MALIDLASRSATLFKRHLRHLIVTVAAALMVTTLVGARSSGIASGYGPFGPEGGRMREQLWIIPGADPKLPLRAVVFRPQDAAGVEKRPLVVINHGTSEDTRLAVSMPVYYWMSRWFVERGYIVVLPQRRGHGATAGPLAEAIGDCLNPDHIRSGYAAADDIEAALRFMQSQPFVASHGAVVAGVSSGGWASLALASRNPEGVTAVINFAGGRGGHAFGVANAVCGEDRLVDAAAKLGGTARIPSIWFYSENDSYFGPGLAAKLATSWTGGGGEADLHVLPAYGEDGHTFADDRAGWTLWGAEVERFLASRKEHAPVVAADTSAETGNIRRLSALWAW